MSSMFVAEKAAAPVINAETNQFTWRKLESVWLAHTTAHRMAAHRKSDRRRDDLCAGGLRKCAKASSKDVQSHHRMNLPCSVTRKILSPVRLIFGSVADVPKCFYRYGDDRRKNAKR